MLTIYSKIKDNLSELLQILQPKNSRMLQNHHINAYKIAIFKLK